MRHCWAPGYEAPISSFHANGYDAAVMASKAIEKVGTTDSEGNLYIGKKALVFVWHGAIAAGHPA
jgi:hypothetical protein